MKLSLSVLSLAVAASAQDSATYRWLPNNAWETASNWASGSVPSGTVNLNQPCMSFGGGADLSILESTSVGSIDFPLNGGILLAGNMELSFTGETANSGSWRCKEGVEMNTACSSNFEVRSSVGGGMQYVPASHPPCYLDTVEINGDVPTQMQFHSGSFIGSISLQGENAAEILTPTDLEAWRASSPRQIVGDSPTIGGSSMLCGGPDQCTRSCMDTCNSFELDEAASNLDAFWNMSAAERDGIIAQTTEELTQVIGLRDGPVQTWMDNEGVLLATLQQWQLEFEEGIDDDAIDNDGATGQGTIHNLQVTTNQMTEWMEETEIGVRDFDLRRLEHHLTVKEARDAWAWYAGMTLNMGLWNSINDQDSLTTAAPVTTTTAPARKARQGGMNGQGMNDPGTGGTGGGGSQGGAMGAGDMGATMMAQGQTAPNNAAQNVNPFIFMDANVILERYEVVPGETWQVVSTHWGGHTAEDPAVNFDAANGAFEWHGLVISGCRVYTDEDGQHRPLVAPAVLEAILSATMTKMSLYQRELYLRGIVHNMPTTTTTLPPQASTSEDAGSSMLMLIIIAAVAVLLLVVIIVVVMKGGGNDDGNYAGAKSAEARGVVAFENPMYDDPNAGGAAIPGGDPGLYDEPSFEGAGKENPMYGSNEKTTEGGGYLDVTPDDEDNEDDDGEDDDDDGEDDE